MEIDLSRDEIGHLIAALALSRKTLTPIEDTEKLIIKLKAERQIMEDMDID